MKPVALMTRGNVSEMNAQKLVDAGYEVVFVHHIEEIRLVSDLSPESRKALVEYLISHDSDIRYGMNDFAELRGVFAELIDRAAIHVVR